MVGNFVESASPEGVLRLIKTCQSNFIKQLPSIIEDVRNCEFISCDGEFTGISNPQFKAMAFDTVSERYEKLMQGNMDYLMCQVGMCMFFHQADGSYQVKPYNFYVTPQQFGQTDMGKPFQFTCQASSMNFLASHGFDFNKVFREGISYLRPAEESKVRDALLEKAECKQARTVGTPIAVKGDDKKFLDNILKKVDEYISMEGDDSLALPPCSPFRRKLIYQHVENKCASQVYLETVAEANMKHIKVTKVNEEQRRTKEKAALNQKLSDLQEIVGFSSVIKEISNCKKLLIGHNMLLDLMYIISQFMAQLPQSYEEFKVMATELFPKLLDTKVMSSTYLFKDEIPFNSLDEMVKVLTSSTYQQVDIRIAEPFPNYEDSELKAKFHDAAYDAYITGKCFTIMAGHVGQKASPPIHNLACNRRLLNPFMNKIFLNRIQDIPYMNLSGPEVTPDREHVYHLSFPSTWTRDDINQVFSPFSVYITWMDATSAMATVQERAENPQVKKLLKGRAHACTICSYAEWHRSLLHTPPSSHLLQEKPLVSKRALNTPENATPEKAAKFLNRSVAGNGDAGTKSSKLFEESSW